MITSGDRCTVPGCSLPITFRGILCFWHDSSVPGRVYTQYLSALRVQATSLTNLMLAAKVLAEVATVIAIKEGRLPPAALAAVRERYRAAINRAWRKEIDRGNRH